MPKTLLLANALGIALGVALVGWTAPQTRSGVVFLIVASVMLCNALSLAASSIASHFRKSASAPKPANSHD